MDITALCLMIGRGTCEGFSESFIQDRCSTSTGCPGPPIQRACASDYGFGYPFHHDLRSNGFGHEKGAPAILGNLWDVKIVWKVVGCWCCWPHPHPQQMHPITLPSDGRRCEASPGSSWSSGKWNEVHSKTLHQNLLIGSLATFIQVNRNASRAQSTAPVKNLRGGTGPQARSCP